MCCDIATRSYSAGEIKACQKREAELCETRITPLRVSLLILLRQKVIRVRSVFHIRDCLMSQKSQLCVAYTGCKNRRA
jgi:hypothetical protein